MCRKNMGDAFDIVHVKEWSYELARAYLDGLTVLSPWRLYILMDPRITSHLMHLVNKEEVRTLFLYLLIV